MRVIVLGQNPSPANVNPKIPFEGTRSGKTLRSWLDQVLPGDHEIFTMNCSDRVDYRPTAGDLELLGTKIAMIAKESKVDKILTLGRTAERVLVSSGLGHFALPHPSGRNRALNNKQWLENTLEWCRWYLDK